MRSCLYIFLVILSPKFILAQAIFDRTINIPVSENGHSLHNPWAGGLNSPKISSIDLNGDGILDMFIYDNYNNRILTFLNNGNSSFDQAWDYAPQYISQFPPVVSYAYLYDYNCDGKADFFTASVAFQCSGIACYKNNYSAGNGFQWTIVDSCMDETYASIPQHIFSNSISLPNFTDFDGDGDMDILGFNTVNDGRILYHKNYSVEHGHNCDSLEFVLESLCLGSFQIIVGGSNAVNCFNCPCRVGRPNPNDPQPDPGITMQEPDADQSVAAKRDDTVQSVFSLDVDGNGAMDLLIGDVASNNTLMVHNAGTTMDTEDTLYPSSDVPALFREFHYHSYLDADNDGAKDLLVMPRDNSDKDALWLYKNYGTTASPIFAMESSNFIQGNMIDAGELACPVLFDYDDDGLLDLVIGKAEYDTTSNQFKKGLSLYKNIGTPANPSFDLITTDLAGIAAANLFIQPVYPAFGDLDGDGDKDMILGVQDGHLHYYNNTAGPGNPANFVGPQTVYMRIDVGNFATPQLYDINKDGLLDLAIGNQRGYVKYFTNKGTSTVAAFDSFPSNDSLGCIKLQASGTSDGYTAPFFYDSLGVTRLVVANEQGNIFQYTNIDNNLQGCFTQVGNVYNPTESSRVKFNITVSGGDLNNDGLTDLVIGQATGGAEIRYQHDPNSGISNSVTIKPTFEVFPNPVHNNMTLQFYNLNRSMTILKMYNSIGELVFQKKIVDEKINIDTQLLVSGLYMVEMISGKFHTTRKIQILK